MLRGSNIKRSRGSKNKKFISLEKRLDWKVINGPGAIVEGKNERRAILNEWRMIRKDWSMSLGLDEMRENVRDKW